MLTLTDSYTRRRSRLSVIEAENAVSLNSRVKHIHDVPTQVQAAIDAPPPAASVARRKTTPAARAAAPAAAPAAPPAACTQRLLRLSEPRRASALAAATDVPGTWERSLRECPVLPMRRPSRRRSSVAHLSPFHVTSTREEPSTAASPTTGASCDAPAVDRAEAPERECAAPSSPAAVLENFSFCRSGSDASPPLASRWAHTGAPVQYGSRRLSRLQQHRQAAALDTLERRFLPLWRRHHEQQRRQKSGESAPAEFAETPEDALTLLFAPPTRTAEEADSRAGAAVLVQRAYRRHRRAILARTRLNVRLLRHSVERAYWDAACARAEEEYSRRVPAGAGKRASLAQALQRAAYVPAVALEREARDVGVYTYYEVGPLPETLLAREVTAALYSRLAAAARRALLVDFYAYNPRAAADTEAGRLPYRTAGARVMPPPGRETPVRTPALLPEETLFAVLDNVCYLASEFRGDPRLTAHLGGRRRSLTAY